MESRPEIAKYLPPDARVASVGIDAARTSEIAGASPVAVYGNVNEFQHASERDLDALLLAPDAVTRDTLAAATLRLRTRGVVVVACEVVAGAPFLDSPAVPPVVRALSESGYSIVTPPRWLDRAAAPSFLIAARHDGYVIRSYVKGDETQILDLFETSFLQRRPLEHWKWEYEANPHGSHAISMAFDAEGRLVAHYAGYPVPLWSADPAIDGLVAHQIGDTMTAVRIRNVGRGNTSLVVRTAKHFFASRCAAKVAFNYGFNTANIRKMSHTFIEVHPVELVPFRRAEVAALKLPARGTRMRRSLLRAYSITRATATGEEFDRFFQRVAPSYGLLVRRDARYLTWRYLDSPDWKYEIIALRSAGRLVGWSVFRRRDDVLVWGDALFSPRHADAAGLLLQHALASPIGSGARFVEGWFPSRPSWWAQEVDALGLTITPEPNDLSFSITPFLVGDAVERLGREFYYTACDSDLY